MGKYSQALHEGKDPVRIIVDAESHIKDLEFTVRDTLVYAFRYALGRSSYCVNDVCIAISKHKDTLGTIATSLIKKEIKEYLESTPTGHIDEWKHLLKELEYSPKGYSMSTLEANKTMIKCTYKGNGFVCYNGYDVEDDRLMCPKCGGTGYVEKEDNE